MRRALTVLALPLLLAACEPDPVFHPLVTGMQGLCYGLQTDGTHLYWLNGSSGTIFSTALDGGAAFPLQTGVEVEPTGQDYKLRNSGNSLISVGEDFVYYVGGQGNEIRKVGTNGEDDQLVLTGSAPLNGVWVRGTTLYWSEASATGYLQSGNLDGSGAQTLSGSLAETTAVGMAMLNDKICLASVGKVMCMDSVGGNEEEVAATSADISGFGATDSALYWLESGELSSSLVQSEPGSAPGTLQGFPTSQAISMASGDSEVFVSLLQDQQILQVDESGGMTELMTLENGGVSMLAHDGWLYWFWVTVASDGASLESGQVSLGRTRIL